MRPVHPKINGTLYRPTAPAACGTATAADDSLGYEVDQMNKRVGIPGEQLDRIYKMFQDEQDSYPVNPENLVNPVTNYAGRIAFI